MEVENQLSYMQEELDAQHEERVQVLLSSVSAHFCWELLQMRKELDKHIVARAKKRVAENEKEAMQVLQPTGWLVGLDCII